MVEDLTDLDPPCDKQTHKCAKPEDIGEITYPIYLPGKSLSGWYYIMTKKYYDPYPDNGVGVIVMLWISYFDYQQPLNYTTKYLQKEPAIFLKADSGLITKAEGSNNEDTQYVFCSLL